jgi:predicted phosphodiesterase
MSNLYNIIPKSYYKTRKADVKLPTNRKILVLADIHCPYHSKEALWEAIRAGQDAGVDTVIILGDMMDFHRISKYPNEPGTLSFQKELEVGAQLAFAIRDSFPNCQILYIEGNHEVRLEAYIGKNAPEFRDLPSLRMEYLLDLSMQDIEYVSKGFIHCGDMSFIHGHEIPGIGGVNPSRKLYAKMKKSAICGHLHRPESFYTRDGAGKMIQCHVIGHLGEPNPAYWSRNDWQHGYAIVEVSKRGYVYVDNVILNG